MDLGIRGRKAIVNGGSAGMGEARFWPWRAKGRMCSFRPGPGPAGSRPAGKSPKRPAPRSCRSAPITAAWKAASGSWRPVPTPDILVGTCAPPPMTPDYRAITDELWRETIDISLLSPVEFMRRVLDGMVERKWGRMVNIATVAAKYPGEIRALSGSTRAALVNYTVAVSKVVAKHNVIINNLLPGMHHSAFVEKAVQRARQAKGTTYEQEVPNSHANGGSPPGASAIATMSVPSWRCSAANWPITSPGKAW